MSGPLPLPRDLYCDGPTVELPTPLAADALRELSVQADFLRRVAVWLRQQRAGLAVKPVQELAASFDQSAATLEQTFNALDFGRVRPGDDDATEH